ncbi:DUF4157 domain-containing protein [Actinoplanes sp. NPDC089786]|uniref:eCIS core domain-containing protein n=1 Tax=Actinoplanes sp. NPDC089786 TaxID=3155185 RepID=UPI003416AAB9
MEPRLRSDEPHPRPPAEARTPPTPSVDPGNAALARIAEDRSAGSPLSGPGRAVLERRFGADFSAVRLHTDNKAAELAGSVQAQAFTTGTDIYFGAGHYQPGSSSGQELIAHELTHVVQQSSGTVGPPGVSHPDDPAEVEARSMARQVMTGEAAPATRAAPGTALVRQLQPAGNRAISRLIQREPLASVDTATLDGQYRQSLATALQTGNFQSAAEKLNGFNEADIRARLGELTREQVSYLHLGAVNNPRVGPQSNVARLTDDGSAPAPGAGAGKAIPDMTTTEKLVAAFDRADIGAAVKAKLLSMITPQALVMAIVGFAAVFIASQFTPVGWAADIALGLTAIFIGTSLFSAAQHLINFADARNATTPEQLDFAGQEFARAVAEIGVDALILLITHTKGGGGGSGGGPPYQGPPPQAMVLGTANGRLVVVVAETVPVQVAAGLAAPAGPMIMAMSGRPRGDKPERDFEPPVRDHGGKAGGELPKNGYERNLAVSSWTREELLFAADELELSVQARQAEQVRLGETTIGAEGQQVGKAHRIRIEEELELLRAIRKKLGGS